MTGGGAATAGGMDFQHRVSASLAVLILAEKDAALPWDLPAGVTLDWLRCETEQPIDDIMAGTSAHGLIFIQAKKTLNLSTGTDSALASVVDQCVRQFISTRNKPKGPRLWDREIDPTRDRFVIVTSPDSSKAVISDAGKLLTRLRSLTSGAPLDDAATNDNERKVLETLVGHARASWQRVTGSAPADADITRVLGLMRFETFDVQGGKDETVAKQVLKASVLLDGGQSGGAWLQLVGICAELASSKSGIDRPGLHARLLGHGIRLQAPPSYRVDIQRLRAHSDATFDGLKQLSVIQVGKQEVKIARPSESALRKEAEKDSLLVVGEPGAGKSGALHGLVEALKKEGRDHVFLAVDRFAAGSLSAIRIELGLEYELVEILRNWPSSEPKFLIIDALDAARGDQLGRAIRELIASIIDNGSWRIVASIRKFDLRYGMELKRMFQGDAVAEFRDEEFRDVRHLNIDILSDEELAQVQAQSKELGELIKTASGVLKDLMRPPFNLRLAADMLGSGLKPKDLTPIVSKVELLERYWAHRVIGQDQDGDSREAVLRDLVTTMAGTRTLRVERASAQKASAGPSITKLLSEHVIVEWSQDTGSVPNREILAFSHHVLFDYSAARLMFRGSPDALIGKLRGDTQLAIVIRPSILMHFQYLWAADVGHSQFWEATFKLMDAAGVPQIAKLIGPFVAADSVKAVGDLGALYGALESKIKAVRESGENAFRHLVGALLVEESGPAKLGEAELGLWCAILERASRAMSDPIAYSIRPALLTFSDRVDELPAEGFKNAGLVARRLLDHAWKRSQRDHWLVGGGLRCVTRTFESDIAASESLLRKALEPAHLAQFGYEELTWITHNVKRIFRFSPSFAEEMYGRVFAFEESSDAPTAMGPGRIFSLTSNRRQDYGMARFELGEAFPAFMDLAMPEATRAMVVIANRYALHDHAPSSGTVSEQSYELGDLRGILRIDYSSIWDSSTYRHDDAMKIVDAFQRKLEVLAKGGDLAALRMVIAEAVTHNKSGFLWRRIFAVAAKYPGTLGSIVRSLVFSPTMLKSVDTTYSTAAFLKAIAPSMTAEEREKAEKTILGLSADGSDGFRISAETRHRLLASLNDVGMVTDEARKIIDALRAANEVPDIEEPVRFHSYSRAFGEVEYLEEQGVDIGADPNRRIRELEAPVKEFAEKNLNGIPSADLVKEILPAESALRKALLTAETDGVAQKQANHAMHYLVAVAARIARADIKEATPDGDLVRDILLDGTKHPEPDHHPEYDEQFDENPSWGSPAARIEAASGITVLARSAPYATKNVLDAIAAMARDPVPAVRYQVACALNTISITAPEFMWGLLAEMSRNEQSRGVLQGLLAGPLQQLGPSSKDKVVLLVQAIYSRIKDGPGSGTVHEFCVGLMCQLHLWRGDTKCEAVIYSIARDPLADMTGADQLVRHFRQATTFGPVNVADPEKDRVRLRAWRLIETLLKYSIDGVQRIVAKNKEVPYGEWDQTDKDALKALQTLIDHLATELYFASGAYRQGGQTAEEDEDVSDEAARRFYNESQPSFELLASTTLPSVTHNLLKTLEYMVPFDPPAVFKQVGKFVGIGRAGGFQYESMAADLIVGLVERYLAEYRAVLQADPECRQALMEILDAFVEAGWPSARRLTYRLDEIFQ